MTGQTPQFVNRSTPRSIAAVRSSTPSLHMLPEGDEAAYPRMTRPLTAPLGAICLPGRSRFHHADRQPGRSRQW